MAHGISRRRFLAGAAGAGAGALMGATPALAGRTTVEVICRQAWGARPPSGRFVRHTIERLTVHHSAVELTRNRDAPQRMRNHQAYHQSLGWPDIAYHLGIDRHGYIYELRPRWAKGDTNTDYDPRGHLQVLCEGDFGVQDPSARMVAALVDVLAWGCRRYDVPVHRIKGHRDHAATSCPGAGLYDLLRSGAIHRKVQRRLEAGGVWLEEICGPVGRALVRAIEAGDS